jgi:hypothetical protein
MRLTCRLAVAVVGVALVVGLVVPPASAGIDPILKVAKKKSGPYTTEIIKIKVGPDEKKDFFLKARSGPGAEPEVGTLRRTCCKPIYKYKFLRGDQNITEAVFGEGYDFTVNENAKRFRGVVKDIGEAPNNDCNAFRLEINLDAFAEAAVHINDFCN